MHFLKDAKEFGKDDEFLSFTQVYGVRISRRLLEHNQLLGFEIVLTSSDL